MSAKLKKGGIDMEIRWFIYMSRDRWAPITWCDTEEEAISFCKTCSANSDREFGYCRTDDLGRKNWYSKGEFVCCTI